ncbi:hypothetical protein L6452_26081 [Arctium lappa]|uniref:Uncharacterized protein n=1 Tax=Arctium lappa TaxID=4217 RepID=A0ACB9ACZ6_ARCLA|nr:hypothetical protein L6452_26081 [Arctium lappa]
MEFFYEDCKSLLEQVNLQEKELRHKRRWLIGLPTSRNDAEGSKFQTERPLPEYLLREDDVSYETIKSFVEKLFEKCNSKNKRHILEDDMQLIRSPRDLLGLFSLVNDMTNQGLHHFAEVLTGGSIKFEKTRWKMKQIIKGCLSEEFSKQKNTRHMNLPENRSLLLKNPHNFRWSSESRFIPDSSSYHAAVHKILDVLEDLPTQTLSAMHRKLRGIKGYMPKLIPKKSGWGRDALIKRLRKKCLGLLSKLSEGDSLQEPLAKAMEVAGLTLKLIQGCHYVTNFKQISPEMNVLQNEIAMSIQLLDQRVKLSALTDIQGLLDPKAKLPERTLRASIRNLLTEYLFECSDMDTVPQCLFEVLAITRKGSEAPYKHLAEMEIDEEVECILSVSASIKQVLWDLIPEHELDIEFADAYMEDLEESDGDDICEDIELEEHVQNNMSHSSNSDEEIGSTGEMEQANFNSAENSECMAEISLTKSYSSAFSTREVPNPQHMHAMRCHLVSLRNMEQTDTNSLAEINNQDSTLPSPTDRLFRSSVGGQEFTHISEKNPELVSSNFSPGERRLMFDNQSMSKNQYLAIQAASDEASVVAYRLIGCMLYDFAQTEGCELKSRDVSYLGVRSYDVKEKEQEAARKEPATHEKDGCSLLIKAVEELIPSCSKCEADRLKELMGSKVVRHGVHTKSKVLLVAVALACIKIIRICFDLLKAVRVATAAWCVGCKIFHNFSILAVFSQLTRQCYNENHCKLGYQNSRND